MPGTSGLLHWPLFPCGSLSPPHSTVGFYTVPISKRVTSGRGFARASEATRHHILSFTATPDSGAGVGGTPMSRWEDDRESATIFNPHTRAREWRAYWWPRRRIGHRSQLSTVFPMTGLSTAAPPPPPRAEGNYPHHHGRLGHVTCFSR